MKLTGGQIVMKYLEREHVPYVLGIPGHGILGFFDALRESVAAGNTKYIQVKHEQAAVHMADGYFRVKGEPLAVFTSIGPGALNTAIGLATAYVDSCAVFQISGDTHVQMKGVGVLQEIERYQDSNFIRALEPLVKRAWRAESAGQLPRVMQRSFNQMLTGRKGPVMIALPMNVQAESADVALPEPELHRAQSLPAGDETAVLEAVRLLKAAKRPVILLGGAALRANEEALLVRLAETLGAAVVTTMAGKSAFPEDHPLYGFHTGSKGTPVGLKLTRTADVILALGTRFADETTCSYKDGVAFSIPKTKLIHVDTDAGEIGKNYPCEVGIVGDLVQVSRQILAAYGAPADWKNGAYAAELLADKAAWRAQIEREREKTFDKITISQLIGELEDCLPQGTIISTSSGNTQAQLFQEYRFTKGQKHLTTGGFSTMGWAFPAALGAKLAAPDRPVIALLGDGDFMMTMQELSTMAQYDIPVVVVLANNRCWMAIKDLQQGMLGEEHLFGNDFLHNGEPYSPDFAAIAQSFGIQSEKISKRGSVKAAVTRALESGRPALIEVDVYDGYPESGGGAYGWWDVPIPAYMTERRAKYESELTGETV
jgi:acetolactate synthase-1/2/3 large subunit